MPTASRGKASSSKKKNSAGNRSGGAATQPRTQPYSQQRTQSQSQSRQRGDSTRSPRRREVMAAVCFILAVFSFIGYRNIEGAFIEFFIGLAKGLLGLGFYALPPALLLCSAILTFHRGRPVRYRVACTLLLTVLIGALWHLFTCEHPGEISFAMFPQQWSDGKIPVGGGAAGGALAVVFRQLFGKIGAAVVLICAGLFLLLSAFNRTIAGIADAIRRRERREYIPDPEPERQPPLPRPPSSSHISQNPPVSRKPPPEPRRRGRSIDIPLDSEAGDEAGEMDSSADGAKAAEGSHHRDGFFRGARVKTPDQLIAEYSPDESGPSQSHAPGGEASREKSMRDEAPQEEPGEIEDIFLDIPFMESRRDREARERASAAGSVHEGRGATEREPASLLSYDDKPPAVKPPPAGRSASAAPRAAPGVVPETAEPAYEFPPLELLSAGTPKSKTGFDEVRLTSDRLEAAFRSFNVNVKISNTTRGPSVTRYEAELEAGVKLSKLTGLADDIALSLGTSGVRIAAMPNKISTVGVEVPNKQISKVALREIIESPAFERAKSKLTFAIGMDISGEAIVGNISKLPHMLVAGTTGSGKSVCLNSLILSILYKATPDEVRFIMIDPKMVEFNVYNEIPHLLVPVVTDSKKAAGALQWAVFEMMKRYTLFKEIGTRDIEGYNHIVSKSKSDEYSAIAHIIVVIDELADLMMMAAKEVEESVCRVAQMGRAAGIHLVISTQSPRADVITGLMKANIPTRIALKVSSALESRIILDAGGNADKLVGNGDMLYAPIGTTKPMRLQGTWVSDEEREKVVSCIIKSTESRYSEEVISEIDKAAMDKTQGEKAKDEPEGSDYDELLPQAVDVIFETGQASVSMLQRRLRLGYSRAARIVDQMEQLGVVGPFEGSKPRAMLVTKEQWRQMQYINGIAPADSGFPEPELPVSDFDDEDVEIED